MTLLRRITGATLRLLGLLLIVLAIVGVAAVGIAGFTTLGARVVTDMIASAISTPDRTITISQPQGLLNGHLRAGTVTVSDTQGVYAEIRDFSIDWSPLALLSRRFEAQRISAGTVALERQPVVTEVATSTGDDGFSLPVAIDVKAVDLPIVKLGEALIGNAASLALKGNVMADNAAIAATLAINRTSVPDAALTADLVYAPASNSLTLEARLTEPEQGILATLLRLPGTPAIDLNLSGDGALSEWKGKLTAAVAGQPRLNVDATHTLAADNLRQVTVKGSGQFDTFLPPALRPLFAGDTQIDLAATFGAGGSVDIETGTIATGSMLLSASGRLDTKGDNDLKANLIGIGGPVDFRWPSGNDEIHAMINGVDVSVTGSAASAKVDLVAALESLSLPQGQLNGLQLTASSDDFDIAGRKGVLDTTVSVASSQFSDETINRAIRAPLTIKAPVTLSPDTISVEGLTLESASIGGTINGLYSLSDASLSGGFRLFALPGVLPESFANKFTHTIGLAGALAYSAEKALSVTDLQLTSNAVEATGSLDLTDSRLTADLKGTLPEIGIFLDNAEGSAAFTLSAKGPLDAIAADATTTADSAILAGRTLQSLDIALSGTADPKQPQATITANGSLDGQAIQLDAELLSRDGRASIPDLTVRVGDNNLKGALDFSPQFLPSGTLDFDFPDIGLLAALGGQTASGDLKGSLKIAGNDNRISMDILATGREIKRDTVTVTAPNIDLAISDIQALAIQGKISAGQVTAGTNRIEAPVLSFSRQGSATDFDLAARYDGAPVTSKGTLTQKGSSLRIALQDFAAAPRSIPLKLSQPAAIRVADGRATIETLKIAAGSGTVTVSGTAGETLDISAAIRNLPAALANPFVAGLDAAGDISGEVKATGSAASPNVTYALTWNNAVVAQTRSVALPPLTITAWGTYVGDRLSLDTKVSGQGGLTLNGGGSLQLSGAKPISMKFAGKLPFALLSGLIANQGFLLEGAADADITVIGTTASPVINGTVRTRGARFIDVKRNLAVEQLTADVALSGNRATISGLSGRLAGGGSLSGGGTIDIASPGLPADIQIKLDKAAYVDGSMFTTSASGTLSLTGPLLASPLLSGKIAMAKTSITVPERLPASLSELNIAHKNAPADVRRQMAEVMTKEENGSSSAINLDLQVSAPSQIFVRGRGIDAELGGDLTIRGTSADPQVSGAFTLRRGRLSIMTKRLDFTEGTITFGGALIPIINLEATSTSNSTTITVTVSGLANDPDVSFSSSPALPQDEILAQLIFGQSMAKLSPLQIAQLADAVGQLAGGRSTSLFNTLRNTIGVDDLDISTDEKGNANVSAGRYLNDRTYLELQAGDGGGKAVINLNVGRGVKLRGEAGGDGSGAAGIFYEKEY